MSKSKKRPTSTPGTNAKVAATFDFITAGIRSLPELGYSVAASHFDSW